MTRYVLLALLALSACSSSPQTRSDMAETPDMAQPIPSSQGIGINDVSVLFPLPTDATSASALLSLSSAAAGGPLLTEAQFGQLLPFQHNTDLRPYTAFRVVAARIDPCFPSLGLLASNPSACQRQLRLVAQPLSNVDSVGSEEDDQPFGAGDASIHLLYDLDEASFTELAQAWLALGTTTTQDRSLALGVNPTLAAEGLGGATTKAFEALIVKYAGPSTLARVTSVNGVFSVWEFMGLDATASGLTPIVIHGIPSTSESTNGTDEQLDSDPTNNGPFDTNADSTELTGLRPLGGTSVSNGNGNIGSHVEFTASAADMQKAFALSYRLEDPNGSFDANTLDCTSCHVAGRARGFAMLNGYTPDVVGGYSNAKRNLSVPADVATTIAQQRAFGYRGQTVAVTQRAVNESAAVADALEAMQKK